VLWECVWVTDTQAGTSVRGRARERGGECGRYTGRYALVCNLQMRARASRRTAVVGEEENIAAGIEIHTVPIDAHGAGIPFPVTDDRFFYADGGTGHQRHSDRRGAETRD
jgi:hypothetical protein